MVEDHVDQHMDSAAVRLGYHALEVGVGAELRIHAVVVRRIIAVIAGRRHYRHQPDAFRAQVTLCRGIAVVDVVELLREPVEIADAVAVRVVERADEDLVADGTALPVRWGTTLLCRDGTGAAQRHGKKRESQDNKSLHGRVLG